MERKCKQLPRWLSSHIWQRDRGICVTCGIDTATLWQPSPRPGLIARRTQKLCFLDHIIPIAKGGAELDAKNIQTLCRSCHDAKSATESLERARERQKYDRERILAAIIPHAMTPLQIAEQTGITKSRVARVLCFMLQDGQVMQPKRGQYLASGQDNLLD